ncbi:MAG TPA: site-specific integrase, partial [Ktedonobacteraceae bacterium]|nr:site-specific integrase [Ktedonobacteraceae bacterium]
ICDLVDPPKPIKVEMKTLDKDQSLRLLAAARGHKWEVLFTIAITTGMRQGELLGLRWADIDMERGTISIKRTVKRVGNYGIIETEPKTAKGKRQISLPPFILDMLRNHQEKQVALQEIAGEKWQNKGMVFCTEAGGYLEGQRIHKPFKRLLAAAGLPDIRFHDLRHSAATLLLAMNEHPKVVQELLGHSNITTTLNTYSHVLPSMHKEAMRKMGDLFKGD